MSVGSQALERSALESKDRESLLQIATAMGGKPGSRAKKADIVDMILELAGVTAPSAPADRPAEKETMATPTAARKRPVRPRAEPDGDATDGSATPANGTSAAASDVAAAIDDAQNGDRSSGGTRASRDLDAGRGTDNARNSGRTGSSDDQSPSGSVVRHQEGRQQVSQGGQSRQSGSGQGGQGSSAPDSSPQGSSNQGGQNQGQPQGQGASQGQQNQGQASRDEESGNRRRRRRGRDRDRPGEGGQGQPQGQGQGQPQGQSPPQGQGQAQPDDQFLGEPVEVAGLLDLRDEGYGFLRLKGYLPSKDDVYVSVKQVRQFGLRKGDHLKGAARPASRNEKNPALLRIDEVNEADPELNKSRARFEDLTAQHPDAILRLETEGEPEHLTARIIDLLAPIGKGQRGLVVSPPKSGRTTILKDIARSLETNHPDVHLIMVLIDERPEEVTAMRRHVQGEVVASTFDRPADEHTMVAELALERAKRLVEEGRDVVIILDGLTRLARAYNVAAPTAGRTVPGGIDNAALFSPKKFFGAARNVEEGGSLTILATLLVETGSTTDELIFEDLAGTANMELRLDRRLADRRIYPAIDVDGSSTRNEELLFDEKQLPAAWKLRRLLHGVGADGDRGAGLEMLIDRLASFKTNRVLLDAIAKE